MCNKKYCIRHSPDANSRSNMYNNGKTERLWSKVPGYLNMLETLSSRYFNCKLEKTALNEPRALLGCPAHARHTVLE